MARPPGALTWAWRLVPGWLWAALAAILIAPWILVYIVAVLKLTHTIEFWMPKG